MSHTNETLIRNASIYAEYVGGLGDAILRMYFSGKTWYGAIDELFGRQRAVVTLMCHNQNLAEVFRWHPKRDRIDVIDLGFTTPFHPWENREWRLDHGLPPAAPCPPYTPVDTLKFYPSPPDLDYINLLTSRNRKLIVMAATSRIDDKTIPEAVRHEIASLAVREGFDVVVVGRSRYFNGSRSHDVPPYWPGVHDAVDVLTVPGTLELVKRAAGVVAADSAILHAAWTERRPVFLLYNRSTKETMIPAGATGYMHGIDQPDTDHLEFSEFNQNRFLAWLGARG